MSTPKYLICVLTLVSMFCVGCQSIGNNVSPAEKVPQTSDALHPPASQVLKTVLFAKGVQIYECAATSQSPGQFAWKFKAPVAELSDRASHIVAKHYAGPTWEHVDGSIVVGELHKAEPAPDANAIPWLLLAAKSTTGHGMFGDVKSIQRLDTVAGKVPTTSCGLENAGEVAKTNYTATYYFYRDGN